jgi:hypothetical protein
VAVVRARAAANTSAASRREAMAVSSAARYSCKERPERAARAASSSRTSLGMLRIVIATMQSELRTQLHNAGTHAIIWPVSHDQSSANEPVTISPAGS